MCLFLQASSWPSLLSLMARTSTLVATSLVSASSSRHRRMRQMAFQSSQPTRAHTHTHSPPKKKNNSKSFIDQASPHKTPVSPLDMLQLEARQNKGQIVLMTIYPLLKDHFKGTSYFANIEPSSEQNYNCKSESFFLELFSLQGKGSSGTSMLASLFVMSLRSYTML